jgi:hypothetical protein
MCPVLISSLSHFALAGRARCSNFPRTIDHAIAAAGATSGARLVHLISFRVIASLTPSAMQFTSFLYTRELHNFTACAAESEREKSDLTLGMGKGVAHLANNNRVWVRSFLRQSSHRAKLQHLRPA